MANVSSRELLRLKERCDSLWFDVGRGIYGDEHLAKLRRYTFKCERIFKADSQAIERYSGVTRAVINNVKTGGRPKLNNFLALCRGLSFLVKGKLVAEGILVDVDPSDFNGQSWVALDRYTDRGEIQRLTNAISDLASKFKGSNLIAATISETERDDLIRLLETAILQLRGPLIEAGFFHQLSIRVRTFVSHLAKKIGEKGLDEAASRTIDVIGNIF